MAKNTNIKLRNSTVYSIFVRNYSEAGTLKAVTNDLDRISSLGVDIIWIMPIYPIGVINRKGSIGSPYAIQDYRSISPEYGTIEDFKELANEVHNRKMKIIMDVVFNHTSHESELLKIHPEFFYRNEKGNVGNKIGDWADVIDLDYNNKHLWDYQMETLNYWLSLGVDGFRCDAAPIIPIEFWDCARDLVSKIKDDVIWLAETSDQGFIKNLRRRNILVQSDSEIYSAFDAAYDNDTYGYMIQYLKGEVDLTELLILKRQQELIFPANYVKMRYLENHDVPRAAQLLKEDSALKNWTAFMFFEKGMTHIYAGQEVKDTNVPSLFEKDLVNWNNDLAFSDFIKKLIQLKKKEIFAYGYYDIAVSKRKGIIEASYEFNDAQLLGIFNVDRKSGYYDICLKDGKYINLIDDKNIEVMEGKIKLDLYPIIIEGKKGDFKNE